MHDEMIDLTAADPILVARLGAYGDARLSPGLATTARMRARVMAVAHRQAALIRADASLAIVAARDAPRSHVVAGTTGAGRRTGRRRVSALLVAASMAAALATGTVLAARPGGPLYETRLSVEAMALPGDPSARAVAELQRLHERIAEATAASAIGDGDGAAAALSAYERILGQALDQAAATGDDVAAAALEAGVGRNINVLRALVATVPDQAAPAIERAIQRALDRSSDAVRTISESRSNRGSGGSGGGSSGGSSGGGESSSKPDPTTKPTKEPKPALTPKPTKAPSTSAPAKPTPNPDATPRPTPRGQSGS